MSLKNMAVIRQLFGMLIAFKRELSSQSFSWGGVPMFGPSLSNQRNSIHGNSVSQN
jgi:hypothetical protein